MKRTLSLFLAMALTLALAACSSPTGQTGSDSTPDGDGSVSIQPEVSGQLGEERPSRPPRHLRRRGPLHGGGLGGWPGPDIVKKKRGARRGHFPVRLVGAPAVYVVLSDGPHGVRKQAGFGGISWG